MAKQVKVLTVALFSKLTGRFEPYEIENSLEAFQQLVGGYIEEPRLGSKLEEHGFGFVLDEEGKLKGKLVSLVIVSPTVIKHTLVGNVIVFKRHSRGKTSITPSDLDFINAHLKVESFNVGGKIMTAATLQSKEV